MAAQGQEAKTSIQQRSEALVAAIRGRETELLEELSGKLKVLKRDVDKRLLTTDNKMTGCQQVIIMTVV